ncbi:MAG: RNA polymerase subunit sigma-70 [Hydrogenophaga sp.]|uniref:anti-sigma factor n=1 Tax=Hydrogenophaga sp. TaxID=1904254 RepID=UPI0016956B0A|nr:anti-sigma factor [Hydrogenophaga sp.]NIM42757.1 RNA polymerase subunit sigma-70 [Hydrogenophaga sp.]NIN25800.1 RNA polymerase subunit sigma-70 [Hydrogenophaga sp.]NIN30462.1 RNA polymerase subunit sigma-70 [Hydrogenophaga sp.]NIN56802.1 RNA polymerase subunit sigma-70 [Hydrogenophaga sp.]NIO53377.1 RNA polymerase subunit sigma-70 [Hydrogenophaga sp.]
MQPQRHPELLQRLAAAYALGTLRGGARRRFETIAREQPVVRAAAIEWQTRVASLNELQTSAEPGPQVWTRIQNLVRAEGERAAIEQQRERAQAAPPRGWWHSLALWRGAGLAGLCAVVAALVLLPGLRGELDQRRAEVAELQRQLLATPEVRYVAVLNDDQARPAVLVTYDAKHNRLSLQRVGGYQEAADRSLQLWALPPGAAPRSLGVLTPERLLQLAASENAVREVPALAISLEPLGGVPSERGPTGPVLFHGPLIQKQI